MTVLKTKHDECKKSRRNEGKERNSSVCVRWVPGRPRPSFGENAAAPAASLSLWEQRVSRRGRGPPAGAEGAARTVPPARPLHGHSPTARAPQGTALPPAPWSRREDVELSRDPGFLKRAQALGPRGESASPVQIRASHSVLVPVLCADATARRAAARSLSRGHVASRPRALTRRPRASQCSLLLFSFSKQGPHGGGRVGKGTCEEGS